MTGVGPGDTTPLSHEQQQLWLLQQLAPEVPPSAECVAVTLRGELDIGALRDSVAAFTGRHEIWRTTFPSVGGEPVQMVQSEGRWAWSVADLTGLTETGLTEAERQKEALRRAAAEAGRPFDLVDGPLVRALLIRLADREHRLFVVAHHMVCDRESLTQISCPSWPNCTRQECRDGRLSFLTWTCSTATTPPASADGRPRNARPS